MSELKFDAIETFILELESVFKACGLQDRFAEDDNKYYFFRNTIPSSHANDKLAVRYVYTQTLNTNKADNTWHSLELIVNATIFVTSQDGFEDEDYKSLVRALETECEKHHITLGYGIDSSQYTVGDITSEAKSKEIEFSKTIKRSKQ